LANRLQLAKYLGILMVCLALGILAGFNSLAVRVDHYAYDLLLASQRDSWMPQSVVVAIDEETLTARGGVRSMRSILAEALDKIYHASPSAVAIDVILADKGDREEDRRLEAAMRQSHSLILSSELVNGQWENPLPRFKALARAIGHVDLEPDRLDGVSRQIPLEEAAHGDRRWALSLETFRVFTGNLHIESYDPEIVESPEDLEVSVRPPLRIPTQHQDSGRPLLIRYLPPGIPTISVLNIDQHRDMLYLRAVFLGVTASSAARDRLLNPLRQNVSGVEVHAHAFETMRQRRFLVPASETTWLLTCLSLAVAAGVIFWLLPGWTAYLLIVPLLATAHYFLPVQFFARGIVLPYVAPVAVAWLSSIGAATYRHFMVRWQLRKSESDKSRYQQAIHWAAHEMRTPLTAIQGSSELMTRYALPDAKRSELNLMINSESKRLARIISTFLDVERLAEGQMELKRESLPLAELVDICMQRAKPLAERKRIGLFLDNAVQGSLLGDRELLEYALYNLLTNAIKYSPPDTQIHVYSELRGADLRLAVQDQGIGMDAKEIKNIFQKFYRTKSAEAFGEAGTGIGLSIVEQIVFQHGGRIEVTSTPGKGSCFTMIMKAHASAATDAETADRRR
jgi:signal transduction histidine kinase